MTDETTEEITEDTPTLVDVMKALGGIAKRLDAHDIQFEAIRQGLVSNSAAFDRLEAVVYNVRSDVANLRADVKELTEEVRQGRKVLA